MNDAETTPASFAGARQLLLGRLRHALDEVYRLASHDATWPHFASDAVRVETALVEFWCARLKELAADHRRADRGEPGWGDGGADTAGLHTTEAKQ